MVCWYAHHFVKKESGGQSLFSGKWASSEKSFPDSSGRPSGKPAEAMRPGQDSPCLRFFMMDNK